MSTGAPVDLYSVFRSRYSFIQNGIKSSLVDLAPKLFERGLIDRSTRQTATSPSLPTCDRANAVMEFLDAIIKTDPSAVYKLLSVLNDDELPVLRVVASDLNQRLPLPLQERQQTLSHPPKMATEPLELDLVEVYGVFQTQYAFIRNSIKPFLGDLAPMLFARNLIDPDTNSTAVCPSIPTGDRVNTVMLVLDARIRAAPRDVYTLMEVLEEMPVLSAVTSRLHQLLPPQLRGQQQQTSSHLALAETNVALHTLPISPLRVGSVQGRMPDLTGRSAVYMTGSQFTIPTTVFVTPPEPPLRTTVFGTPPELPHPTTVFYTPPEPPYLDELMEEYGIEAEARKRVCSDAFLAEVAEMIGDADLQHTHLYCPPETSANDTPLLVLKRWKERHAFKATFETLIQCLWSAGMFDLSSVCLTLISGHRPTSLPTVEEERPLSAFRDMMAKKGQLKRAILHCVLFGFPGTGKSSLLKWITGQPLSPRLPSTGVAEKAVVVEIRRLTTSTTMVQHSGSQHGSATSPWRILSIDEEAVALMAAAVEAIAASDEPISATPIPSLTPTSVATETTGDSSHVQSQPILRLDVLKKAFENEGPERIQHFQQFLQDSLTLYLTDTGGQLEFQELLPALTAGPIIFFLVFRLDQDLGKTVSIQYRFPDGKNTELYQSSLTVMETLQRALASIASMGTHMDKRSEELDVDVALKPSVIFIGTHRDKVSPERIRQIDHNVEEMVRATSFSRGIVVRASESQFVVTVNNLSPKDSDRRCIQSVIERIAKWDNFEVSLPSTWLYFSLLIRQHAQKRRVITFSDCFDLAKTCGIESHEDLKHALWFLNTKVGLVRYFEDTELEDFEHIVIIDPQVIFDKLTRLIVNTFTFGNVRSDVLDDFKSAGIFPLSVVERMWREDDDDDRLLTVDRFIRLLEHLHIISRLQLQHTTKVMYFMPCSLVHAQSNAPGFPYSSTASSSGRPQQIPPLLLTFKCGYCPMGLFSALIVYLLANKMKSHFDWSLKKPYRIFRNAISLYIPPHDFITLTVLPMYLEVAVFPAIIEGKRDRTVEAVCMEVRRCIEVAIQEVASTLHYTSGAEHSLAFYCTGKHEAKQEPHPVKVAYVEGSPSTSAICEMGAVCNFDCGHDLWFNAVRLCPQHQTLLSMEDYEEKISPAKRGFVVSTPTQIANIAEKIETWECISHLLEISHARAEEIKKNNTDYLEQKKRALKTWSESLGHEATYVALMRIFYEDKNITMVEELLEQLNALPTL